MCAAGSTLPPVLGCVRVRGLCRRALRVVAAPARAPVPRAPTRRDDDEQRARRDLHDRGDVRVGMSQDPRAVQRKHDHEANPNREPHAPDQEGGQLVRRSRTAQQDDSCRDQPRIERRDQRDDEDLGDGKQYPARGEVASRSRAAVRDRDKETFTVSKERARCCVTTKRRHAVGTLPLPMQSSSGHLSSAAPVRRSLTGAVRGRPPLRDLVGAGGHHGAGRALRPPGSVSRRHPRTLRGRGRAPTARESLIPNRKALALAAAR
jgi:hypothetical protein